MVAGTGLITHCCATLSQVHPDMQLWSSARLIAGVPSPITGAAANANAHAAIAAPRR
ncbi:hypothetical protein [Mycobacterium shottsii]|uniref:hypothetical protein n=1 Tax=Mycobacterium shottsii TaxID=133549 RepID=UPI0018E94707|nr:hypothetical protein [Mycobacterium shottsii]